MKKSRKIEFFDSIHYVKYSVLIGSLEDFKKLVNKKYPHQEIGNETARCLFKTHPDRECFIYLKKLDIPCLAHEAVHAGIAVIDDIGSRVTLDTDEHLAYYVQWLVGTIYHNLKKNGILSKK